MNVVFFCIGAAKAGTDWLHRQLIRHPECHLRSIKELHYFDAVESGQLGRELDKHSALQSTLMNKLARSGQVPNAEQARRLSDRAAWLDVLQQGREDTGAYLDYLTDGAGQGQLVADITPAYALLPETRLKAMSQITGDVRFLYLLRDPIDRLWSHVRMIAVRRDPEGRIRRQRCANILNRAISGDEAEVSKRSDYATTLQRLTAAVPGPKVLVQAFEDMIESDGLLRLCRFLGISPMAGDAVPVHSGQALEMTRDQRQAAALWLAPQYDAAEMALGGLPQGWAREG